MVAIDQRIAVLQEECTALKMEASSYRNDFLRCEHQLSLNQKVLQQHSNIALRNLHVCNPDVSSGTNKVPYISTFLLSNEQTASNPQQTAPQQTTPQQTAPQQTAPQQTAPQQTAPQQTAPQQTAPQQTAPQQTAPQQTAPQQTPPQQTPPQQTPPQTTTTHMPMRSSCSGANQTELKNDNSQTPITKSSKSSVTSASCSAITVPAELTSALSMTSSSKQSGATFLGQALPGSLMFANNLRGQYPSNNTVRPPAVNRHMGHPHPMVHSVCTIRWS